MEYEIAWACGMPGSKEKCVQILVVKPEIKWPLGRPRHRWEDSIKMDLKISKMGGRGRGLSGSEYRQWAVWQW